MQEIIALSNYIEKHLCKIQKYQPWNGQPSQRFNNQ